MIVASQRRTVSRCSACTHGQRTLANSATLLSQLGCCETAMAIPANDIEAVSAVIALIILVVCVVVWAIRRTAKRRSPDPHTLTIGVVGAALKRSSRERAPA